MTPLDYTLALGALALILLNMRAHELTDRRLRRPVLVAAAVTVSFVHAIPTTGADGALVALGILIGVACGAVSALATGVRLDPATGTVTAAASGLAVGLTTLTFGSRIAFAIAATNGLGPAIARFSAQVGIHSRQAWVAALVLMAAADLVTRALILWQRRGRLTAPGAIVDAHPGQA